MCVPLDFTHTKVKLFFGGGDWEGPFPGLSSSSSFHLVVVIFAVIIIIIIIVVVVAVVVIINYHI